MGRPPYTRRRQKEREASGRASPFPTYDHSFFTREPDHSLTTSSSLQSLLSYLAIKSLHFSAVAQYRKSVDDLGANRLVSFAHVDGPPLLIDTFGRYGDELGRLEVADGLVKKAMAVPKRGVADSVLRDLKVSVAVSHIVKHQATSYPHISLFKKSSRTTVPVLSSPFPPASSLPTTR
jgi:programmed cell death 6-interacting protein